MLRIGLISDTHGLMRPEAVQFLRGCDHIIHAGDLGREQVVDTLAQLAPLTAVRGNIDAGDWAASFPDTQTVNLGGVTIFVLHDLKELKMRMPPADAQVVVCGHSHQPRVIEQSSGLLIVNPGSAGPRRFRLPVTAAELMVTSPTSFSARIVDLLGE
ncbi:MAG TPA: metallophosphoesterase family protein [Ramlibacter sp.]|nr:metallophosphoesterase family protein [Ramlibacter sp.]